MMICRARQDNLTAALPASIVPHATSMSIRVAAIIASDAPASSYLFHLGPPAAVGVTLDQAQSTLVAVAPIVGTPWTAAAAPRSSRR